MMMMMIGRVGGVAYGAGDTRGLVEMTRGLEVLPGMLPVLESAAQCVQQGWLTLLVGGPGSGTVPTACTACQLVSSGKIDQGLERDTWVGRWSRKSRRLRTPGLAQLHPRASVASKMHR